MLNVVGVSLDRDRVITEDLICEGDIFMKKEFLELVKSVVENVVVKSANTTSSIFAHQPSEPKGIEKYKKKINYAEK